VRKLSGIVVLATFFAASPLSANEVANQVTGEVVSARGRWTRDGLIVTDAVIRDDDGVVTTVMQPGGRADGYGQVMYPSPPPLEVGARVTVRFAPSRFVEDVAVLTASSFVRTGPTKAGHYLYWPGACVFMNPDQAGTQDLEGDREFAIIDEAIQTWNESIAACSYLELRSGTRLAVSGTGVGRDGANRIIFRDDTWCRPRTDDTPEFCLPRGAAGLTTVTFVDDTSSSRDGEIVDADVELNGEEFAISADGQSNGQPTCLSDLSNTLTHELGHVIGFDHTCLVPSDPPKVDGDGNVVPLCTETTDPEIIEATMYNFQDCGETKKATLSDTDIAGACAAYPILDDPAVCEPVGVQGGCCSSGGGGAAAAGPVLLTVLLAAGGRRRRSGG